MRRLRVGIVGCGEVTQIMHLPSLAQLAERFVVTALCDVSAEVLEGVGAQAGVGKRYTDYRDLLREGEVDVVLVANPDAYHAEVALAGIAAGKHVLIEKPMCMSLREADEIVAAQLRAGVTVQVGYMRRYAPAFVEACRAVAEVGEIRLARVHAVLGQNALFVGPTSRVVRGGDVPADVIAAGRQRRSELLDEALGDAPAALRGVYGLLLGLSSHDISAMRELLGMPVGVLYARAHASGRYVSAAFDYGGFVCQFETGIDDIPRFDAHIEVYGSERVLRVQFDTPYVRNLPVRLLVTEANRTGGVVERAEHVAWGDPFVAEWLAFHESVTEGREAKTSPADFRKDLELFRDMIAAMRGPGARE